MIIAPFTQHDGSSGAGQAFRGTAPYFHYPAPGPQNVRTSMVLPWNSAYAAPAAGLRTKTALPRGVTPAAVTQGNWPNFAGTVRLQG